MSESFDFSTPDLFTAGTIGPSTIDRSKLWRFLPEPEGSVPRVTPDGEAVAGPPPEARAARGTSEATIGRDHSSFATAWT
jgi:hypothetical protein